MLRSLWTGATGMNVQQVNMDVISNNLANVNTTGYKMVRAEFQDLLYQSLNAPGSNTSATTTAPHGLQVGLGAKMVATNRVHTQGSLRNTGRTLDMAISGNGFFEIALPDGTQGFTRDGSFTLNQDGQLVDSQGNPTVPGITIPQGAVGIFIGRDGTVSYDPGDGQIANAGQLQLTNFANPSGLKVLGSNIYQATQASGDPQVGSPNDPGFGAVESMFLEGSNVNIAEEMINMIIGQRAFEANSRSIRTSDQLLTEINALKR